MVDVTLKQFNDFLAAKAPEKACPECGTNHWLVTNMDPKAELNIPTNQVFRGFFLGTSGFGFPVYPMCCSNCGFVKSYGATQVENWVEKNG